MNATSGILLLFLIPLVIVSSWGLAQHPVLPFRSKRLVNIHTLPGLVSRFAPSVIPVLAARAVFEEQVGDVHDGLLDLTPCERALLAVFGLQVFLNDRKAATRLLDDLNRSCMIKGLLRRKTFSLTPLYGLADAGFDRVAKAPGVSEWLQSHRSMRTALVALYGRDLRLAPARFRWLKGVNRTLWYALHSADTAKVFVEGAGVQAQAR
ncbi:secretion/conjugation apparatus DotM-related subunit, partial [Pseudomonas syringae group genomosp. 3]|uniref:secretion/conjugation apparatus DotM-related subunit n=1 Tax=Pseudomonas syringae group genomosp. 3 TaxID=251701 RepID=UPI003F68A52B